MNTIKFLVDDDFDFIECATIERANIVATRIKKEHPLRTVMISRVINTPNGELIETIAEA